MGGLGRGRKWRNNCVCATKYTVFFITWDTIQHSGPFSAFPHVQTTVLSSISNTCFKGECLQEWELISCYEPSPDPEAAIVCYKKVVTFCTSLSDLWVQAAGLNLSIVLFITLTLIIGNKNTAWETVNKDHQYYLMIHLTWFRKL